LLGRREEGLETAGGHGGALVGRGTAVDAHFLLSNVIIPVMTVIDDEIA
jgi:hypothetical protein